MPVDIDGFKVLGAIAARPEAFPALRTEINKSARALVGKQLKDKALGVEGLMAIAAALESEAFDLIADALTDAEIKALLAKVDRQNAEIKGAAAAVQRRHLIDLATGATAPAAKAAPVKAAKPPKDTRPVVERAGNSKAMRAKRKV